VCNVIVDILHKCKICVQIRHKFWISSTSSSTQVLLVRLHRLQCVRTCCYFRVHVTGHGTRAKISNCSAHGIPYLVSPGSLHICVRTCIFKVWIAGTAVIWLAKYIDAMSWIRSIMAGCLLVWEYICVRAFLGNESNDPTICQVSHHVRSKRAYDLFASGLALAWQ
jgi:hypothetical protein